MKWFVLKNDAAIDVFNNYPFSLKFNSIESVYRTKI